MKSKGHDNRPQIALGILVVGAIAAGLWTVGGPMQARLEQHDQTRLQHLREMSNAVECRAERDDGQLPETFEPGDCFTDNGHSIDPFTETPYRYEKLSAVTYKLCATFEAPDSLNQTSYIQSTFDPKSGCITFTFNQ